MDGISVDSTINVNVTAKVDSEVCTMVSVAVIFFGNVKMFSPQQSTQPLNLAVVRCLVNGCKWGGKEEKARKMCL